MSTSNNPEASASQEVIQKSKIDEAKELLAAIKAKSFDSEEFKKLDELLLEVRMNNEVNKAELFSLIDTAIREDSSILGLDKKGLMKLKNKWFKNYEKAVAGNEEAKGEVKKETKQETTKLIDDKNHIDLLVNLDGDYVLDNETRDFVTEKKLKKALSHASEGGKDLGTVYNRVVGENPNWNEPKETVKKFQEALRVSIDFIRQTTDNGNAGLDALLMGKTDIFVKNVLSRVQENDGKSLEVKMEDSTKITPLIHNILGALGTAVVIVASEGMVTVGHEKHQVTQESILKELQRDPENNLGDKATSVLRWIKEAFMGRRLSINFGKETVVEYKKNILSYAGEVMRLTPTSTPSDIARPELKIALDTALRAAKSAGVDTTTPQGFEQVQKVLIKSYIIGEGFKNQGSDWSGAISPLFIGAHREEVAVKTKKTEVSDYNKAELDATKKSIDKKTLSSIGVEETQKDGKWIYKVPTEIQLSGDDGKVPVTSRLDVDLAINKYIFTSNKQQSIHFTNTGDAYELTFGDSVAKTKSMTEVTKTKQKGEKVKSLRSATEKLANKDIADMLYFMGHSKEPQFQKFIGELARQDFMAAKESLNAMKKGKYKGLATKLLKDANHMESWTSYMYGNQRSRAAQEYTQKYVDKNVRTPDVIRAEYRLAGKLGITGKTDEKQFNMEKGQKFNSVQASSVFPGQEMTISCFATPRGGLHRTDTYDGSVMMSSKHVEITDPLYKKQIIEATIKNTSTNKGIKHQLDKLNTFLATNKPGSVVTMDQYKKYLVSGDMADLGVSGLQAQSGKDPKVFEGRAMIAGNVCLNRLHGIVYPLFALAGAVQQAESIPTVDVAYSTTLDTPEVLTTQDVGGLNPTAALIHHINKGGPSGTPSNPSDSGSSNTGSGIGGGGNATPPK